MAEVPISVRETTGGCSVITIEGGLDAFVVTKVKDVLNDLVARGATRIVIDMKNVQEINSTALGILVTRLRRVRLHGGDMKLCGLSEDVRRVFDVMGASRIFEIFDDVEDAARAFDDNAPPLPRQSARP